MGQRWGVRTAVSILVSAGLLRCAFTLIGLSKGSEREGDPTVGYVVLTLLLAFLASLPINFWFLHRFVGGVEDESRGAAASAVRWFARLPQGLRILGELGVAIVSPVFLVWLPLALLMWWKYP